MRAIYMIHMNQVSGCVFVKELEFFRSQGGFVEDWGRNWIPVMAESIEKARKNGCTIPGARSYQDQAVAEYER